MTLSMPSRIAIVLIGLVLIFSNFWRPFFGMALLSGPFVWSVFAAGIILILAALVNHPDDVTKNSS